MGEESTTVALYFFSVTLHAGGGRKAMAPSDGGELAVTGKVQFTLI